MIDDSEIYQTSRRGYDKVKSAINDALNSDISDKAKKGYEKLKIAINEALDESEVP